MCGRYHQGWQSGIRRFFHKLLGIRIFSRGFRGFGFRIRIPIISQHLNFKIGKIGIRIRDARNPPIFFGKCHPWISHTANVGQETFSPDDVKIKIFKDGCSFSILIENSRKGYFKAPQK